MKEEPCAGGVARLIQAPSHGLAPLQGADISGINLWCWSVSTAWPQLFIALRWFFLWAGCLSGGASRNPLLLRHFSVPLSHHHDLFSHELPRCQQTLSPGLFLLDCGFVKAVSWNLLGLCEVEDRWGWQEQNNLPLSPFQLCGSPFFCTLLASSKAGRGTGKGHCRCSQLNVES